MVGWANLKISVMFYVISLMNVLFLVLFLGKDAPWRALNFGKNFMVLAQLG